MLQKNTRILIRSAFAVLLLLVASCSSGDDQPHEGNEEAIEVYIQQGLEAYDSARYDLAQSYFDSAHYLVTPQTDTAKRIRLLFNQTEILKLKGDYDTCLTNYYTALQLSKLTSDTSRSALALYNIAAINYYLGQYDECLKNATHSLELFSSVKDKGKIANCYTMMAIAMGQLDSPENVDYLLLALQYYQEAKEMRNVAICYNNLGNHYLGKDEYNKAAEYYKKAVEIVSTTKDNYNHNISCGNYGESLIYLGRYAEARFYIDSSMRMSQRLESKESIELNYQRLANYFEELGDKDSALIMMNELIKARTERLKIEADILVKTMESDKENALSLVESQAEVAQLEDDKIRGRIILWFVISVGFILMLGAYLLIRKQRQIRQIDRDLHEKEKKALEAETALKEHVLKEQEAAQARLESELEFKRQELIKFSLTISEREEFFSNLRSLVQQISPSDTQKPEVIKEIRMMLQGGADDGKTELYRQINEMNHSFVFNLKSAYPILNEDDIRLASLLLIDLSSKEIADILSIEAKSVDMKRYRLKKKLELDADVDLKTFLQQI